MDLKKKAKQNMKTPKFGAKFRQFIYYCRCLSSNIGSFHARIDPFTAILKSTYEKLGKVGKAC